jgi:hypothetical protein
MLRILSTGPFSFNELVPSSEAHHSKIPLFHMPSQHNPCTSANVTQTPWGRFLALHVHEPMTFEREASVSANASFIDAAKVSQICGRSLALEGWWPMGFELVRYWWTAGRAQDAVVVQHMRTVVSVAWAEA